MAIERSEATPLPTTVGRVQSLVHVVEKGVQKRNTSLAANIRTDKQTRYSKDYNIRHYGDGEADDSGQGRYSAGPATFHLHEQAARQRPYSGRLQYPEGVDAASGASSARRHANPRNDKVAPDPTRVSWSAKPNAIDSSGTPDSARSSTPQLSQRDPLGLMDKPRIPSPRTCKIIGDRWFVEREYRPATKEWEAAGKLPGAKSVDAPIEYDCYGRPIPKPGKWYFPAPSGSGREIAWNLGPWEVHLDRGVALLELTGKAKATSSPQTRLREGQLQQRGRDRRWRSSEKLRKRCSAFRDELGSSSDGGTSRTRRR